MQQASKSRIFRPYVCALFTLELVQPDFAAARVAILDPEHVHRRQRKRLRNHLQLAITGGISLCFRDLLGVRLKYRGVEDARPYRVEATSQKDV
jgi:hypothetical protein